MNTRCFVLFKVEVRYNLPSSRNEICKFELTTNVTEIKENEAENLFGPVQDEADEEGDNDKDKDKGKGKGKDAMKKCKKLRNKKKKKECRDKAREAAKDKDKDKDEKKNKNKKPPPKHQPVKSIHLKVCTR